MIKKFLLIATLSAISLLAQGGTVSSCSSIQIPSGGTYQGSQRAGQEAQCRSSYEVLKAPQIGVAGVGANCMVIPARRNMPGSRETCQAGTQFVIAALPVLPTPAGGGACVGTITSCDEVKSESQCNGHFEEHLFGSYNCFWNGAACTSESNECTGHGSMACKSVPEILSCLNVPACNGVASGENSCYAGYPNNFETNIGGNWPCFIDNYVDCGCQLACPPRQVNFSCWGPRGCAPKFGPIIRTH